MRTQISSVIKLAVCAIVALAVTELRAADKEKDKKADPNGTWTWTMQGGRRGGQGGNDANANAPARKSTLKLKAEGEKLAGTLTSPGFGRRGQGGDGQAPQPQETQISDGKITGDQVSFTVKREVNNNTFTSKYSGKIDGDTIKGKIESERNGQTQSRDWEAKREK
jgi:hypothetical protein